MTSLTRLILASASPRRRQLLSQVNIPFTVHPSKLSEEPIAPGATAKPAAVVQRLALAKARAVWRELQPPPGHLVLGADTVVVLEQQLLGKPADALQAGRMLRRLSGRRHTVHTGLALVAPGGREIVAAAGTNVFIRPLDAAFIAAYVATGEPFDKAGGYGIQDRGSLIVERLEGCYFNVVGLPLTLLADMLKSWHVRIEQFWQRAG